MTKRFITMSSFVVVYVFMYADHISHKIRHHTLPINLVVRSQEALTSG